MITQDQIGPKLPPIDHSTDEKQFLESKKEVGSNVLDEPWEKQSSAPITWLGPIIQENNYSPSKFASQKRSAVYLSAAEIKLNNHKEIKSPTTAAINRGEKKKQIVNLFSVFKRAKTFVVKVKRNIFFKNYRNMTQWQKNILNDATVFADHKRKKRNWRMQKIKGTTAAGEYKVENSRRTPQEKTKVGNSRRKPQENTTREF